MTRRIIKQMIVLAAPAELLFAMYLDPVGHEAITGAPVAIGSQPNAPFRAFDGMLSGATLAIVTPSLIVQSWRSAHFLDQDPDSTLILSFTPLGKQGRIDLVHLDVPDQDFQVSRKAGKNSTGPPGATILRGNLGELRPHRRIQMVKWTTLRPIRLLTADIL
jgi:Activator of Hsp90 ATPase homolog 1-like protein